MTIYKFAVPLASASRQLVIVLGCAACTSSSGATPAPSATSATPAAAPAATPPTGHYCNLAVFTPEEHARHQALVPKLAAAVTARHELDNGYSFDFPGTVKEAGEWLDGVRRCCPTVDFDLVASAHQGPAVLRITGVDAKPFIREEFGRLFEGH